MTIPASHERTSPPKTSALALDQLRHAPAVLVFAVVYLLLTWPLAKQMDSAILGSVVGDGWKVVEQFWWYKHALVEKGVSPLFDPNIFYPEGWYTLTSSHSPALMLTTIPFTLLFGPIGAYNLLMLLSFVWAGLGTYAVVNRLTEDRLAGVLSGVAYAFCMSRLLRAGGHFNVSVGSAWIPWIFFCLESARRSRSRRQQLSWLAAAGASYAGAMIGYWYFVYLVAIPLAAYFLFDLWQARQDRVRLQAALRAAAITFGVAAVPVIPLGLLTLQARAVASVSPFSFESTANLAASLDRFLVPGRYHPLWGAWLAARFPDFGEQSFVFLGFTVTFLAFLAVLKRVQPRTNAYVILALTSLVMALGPELYWNGAPVAVPLPGSEGSAGIPLPGLFFFRFAPMFNVIRVWARFALITPLAVAVLAGLMVAYLRHQSRWRQSVPLLLLALVVLESWGQPFTVVPATAMNRAVDQWLAAQPEQTAIMELPLDDRLNGSLMYSRTLHGKQLATGYTAAIPGFFLAAVPEFAIFPNQETIQILQQWNVRYLLYTVQNLTVFEAEVAPAINQLDNLAYVATFGGYPGQHVYVYLIEENNP